MENYIGRKENKISSIRTVVSNPASYTEGDKKLALYNLNMRIKSSASWQSHGNWDGGDILSSIPPLLALIDPVASVLRIPVLLSEQSAQPGCWLSLVQVSQAFPGSLLIDYTRFAPGGSQGRTVGKLICCRVHCRQKTRAGWCQNGLLQPGTESWHDSSRPCAHKTSTGPGERLQGKQCLLLASCSGGTAPGGCSTDFTFSFHVISLWKQKILWLCLRHAEPGIAAWHRWVR